jgi:LmbE family N-acetylglucosaminyl deacetylase
VTANLGILEHAERVLAVSPHLDDAILSVAATLARCATRGASVTVFTVFAGTPTGALGPFALEQHRLCGLPEDATAAFARRREEDACGTSAIGASSRHGTHLEVIYRRDLAGNLVCETIDDVWKPPSPADLPPGEIEGDIRALIAEIGADLILGPAAVGGNVDHVATSQAVRFAAEASDVPSLFWEDQPYGWNLGVTSSAFVTATLDEKSCLVKEQAVGCYRSQTQMLWPDRDWRAVLAQAPYERFCAERDLT